MGINTFKKDLRIILGVVTGVIPVVGPICATIVLFMKKQYHYILVPLLVLGFTLYFFSYKSVNTYEKREDLEKEIEERILSIEFDPGLLKIDDLFNRQKIIKNRIYDKIYYEISDLIDLGTWNRDGREQFREFIDSFSYVFDSSGSKDKDIIFTEHNTLKVTPEAYSSHSFKMYQLCQEYIDMEYPNTWMDDFGFLIFILLWVGMLVFNLFVFMRLL